jgi:hypothetical protein
MCDFSELLQQYTNTLPGKHLLFRVSKQCGYSQLVIMPRMQTSNQITVSDLLTAINENMGDYAVGQIYYYPKLVSLASSPSPVTPIFLTHQTAMREPLAQFALTHLPTAYSVDQCKYAVYQLYVNTHCHENNECSCISEHPAVVLPIPPPLPPALPRPQMIREEYHRSFSMSIDDEDEPTREELLSLMYDEAPPPSPEDSTQPPASGLVTPWG